MTQKLIALFLIFSCGWACQLKTSDTPKSEIIDDATMVKILVDVHIAEAAVSNLTGVEKDSILEVYYQYLFKKYNISDTIYRQNMTLLTTNPEKMLNVYQKVMADINKDEIKKQ